MKKYAIVETAKSTRIFISALTWFFLRTVPSSRNAKPACIASTMIAPSRMNRTSEDVFRASMRFPRLRRAGGSYHFAFGTTFAAPDRPGSAAT